MGSGRREASHHSFYTIGNWKRGNKETQTKGILERENLDKETGTTDESITNRIQEMEERMSGVEDTIEEKDSLVKESAKSNKFLTQNIPEC